MNFAHYWFSKSLPSSSCPIRMEIFWATVLIFFLLSQKNLSTCRTVLLYMSVVFLLERIRTAWTWDNVVGRWIFLYSGFSGNVLKSLSWSSGSFISWSWNRKWLLSTFTDLDDVFCIQRHCYSFFNWRTTLLFDHVWSNSSFSDSYALLTTSMSLSAPSLPGVNRLLDEMEEPILKSPLVPLESSAAILCCFRFVTRQFFSRSSLHVCTALAQPGLFPCFVSTTKQYSDLEVHR